MKLIRAHRASWIIHFGSIPQGKLVLHKCDNRICSNPEHLFLGTLKDNMLDMISKKRSNSIGARGENSQSAVLKKDEVLQIRHLLKLRKTQASIAKIFHVTQATIGRIKRNISWKDTL